MSVPFYVLNIETFETGAPPERWGVRRTNFEFVSKLGTRPQGGTPKENFGFRISDFGMCVVATMEPNSW